MCYWSCVKDRVLPSYARSSNSSEDKLDKTEGKPDGRKSQGASPKLRTEIPTADALKGLHWDKCLAIYIQEKLGS